jgi:hypothetical protein
VKPRVFISHSAKESLASETIEALYDELSGRFDVFLDRERLRGGDWWQDEIYRALASCHAAVLVLSDAAVNDSYWVGHEASILSLRAHVEPNFVVVPAFLPPVTPADLGSRQWEPRNLAAIQGVQGNDPAALARQVNGLLDPVATRYDASAPGFRLEQHVAGQLETVPERVVELAACCVELDVTAWTARGDKHAALAQRLLAADLHRLYDAAAELHVHDPVTARNVFSLAAPSWVHPDAAAALLSVVESDQLPKAAAVNSDAEDTCRMYVRRADYRLQLDVLGLGQDERAEAELSAGIRAALLELYGLEEPDDVNEVLSRDPAVLIVPHPPPARDAVDGALRPYSNITLFFMTGAEGRPILESSGLSYAVYLEPELEPARERSSLTAFRSGMHRLDKGA